MSAEAWLATAGIGTLIGGYCAMRAARFTSAEIWICMAILTMAVFAGVAMLGATIQEVRHDELRVHCARRCGSHLSQLDSQGRCWCDQSTRLVEER